MSASWIHLCRRRTSTQRCVVSPCARSAIHVLPCSASFTDLFFLRECLNSDGYTVFSAPSPVQGHFQKEAVVPSPRVTDVEALKSARSSSSHGSCMPFHGLCGLVHDSHSHLSRSALEKRCRSNTPRPPLSTGEQTIGQLTLHFPPLISSSCAHRKRRLTLSISSRNFLGARRTARAKVGSAVSMLRTRTRLPAMFSSFPFYPANLALILSRMN